MAGTTNKQYKKAQRKADEDLEPRLNRHGKQPHQRMKPYLILDYLMRFSDEDSVAAASDLIAYLEECGICADRRSIYKDIDEINKILWMLDNSSTIDEAEEVIDEDKEDAEKYILYDKKKKGFYVKQRKYDTTDIRLLAESVYASRFIDEKRAKKLVNVACSLVSEEQARAIQHDAFLIDRVKTTNTATYYSVSTIHEAMRKGTRDEPHIPHKISFKYLKHSVNDPAKQVEKRSDLYIVSPFKLLINDGNYYLLAYSDKDQEMRTYRVDRMKEVTELQERRDGEHEFLTIDLSTFARRTFGMFNGRNTTITFRFSNVLLDTAVDRFGTKGVRYSRADDEHFYLETEIAISVQFFGWLLGFGDQAQIMGPASVAEEFKAYLDKVRSLY